jgi:hypothetical protein
MHTRVTLPGQRNHARRQETLGQARDK